jgi:cytoskeletal protein RodZ
MSVGTYLREAREAAGYSVEEISSLTRIRPAVIKDLEAENFISSGGNAYARGHIRTIAQIVHTDLDRLLTAFEECTGENNRPMIELLEENNATSLRQRGSVKVSRKVLIAAVGVVAGVAIIIPSGLAIAKKVSHKNVAVSTSRVQPSQPQVVTPATTTATQGVVLTAKSGTSWLSVVDVNGTLLFSGKLSNGQSQSFDPTNGLSMRIGNAGAISVSVNGKDQGSIGGVGEVKTLSFAPAQTNG